MFGEVPRGSGSVLVVYFSASGNTARVARDIARLTDADVESLRDPAHSGGFGGYLRGVIDAICAKPAQIGPLGRNPRDYMLTIVGTPVWGRHMTPAVLAYLQRFKAEFRNLAFFVTSGDTDAERIVPSMETVAGQHAIAYIGFNAAELADRATYEARVASFVKSLQAVPPPRATREATLAQAAR